MNRSLLYSLLLLIAAFAVLGVAQTGDDGVGDGSAAQGRDDVGDADGGEGQDGAMDMPQDAASPDTTSRSQGLAKTKASKSAPGKKRKWLLPVAIIGGIALLAAAGGTGFYFWNKNRKTTPTTPDKDKNKEKEEKKDGEKAEKVTPETTPKTDAKTGSVQAQDGKPDASQVQKSTHGSSHGKPQSVKDIKGGSVHDGKSPGSGAGEEEPSPQIIQP